MERERDASTIADTLGAAQASKRSSSLLSRLLAVKTMLESLVHQMQDGNILYAEAVSEFRKVFITSMLERHRGNQSRGARALGMHRNTLSRAMMELGITAKRVRGVPAHHAKSEWQTA